MKKCTSCGFDNEDDARFCAGCGGPLADAPVANEQAAPVQADDPFAEPAAAPGYEQSQDQQPQEAKQNKGFKATVASVRDKTVGFEKKHSVILNTIVMLCSLVVILVALLAPIKVVNYQLILPEMSVSYEKVKEGDEKETYTVHYVEISQSIWQIIGSLSYIGSDAEKVAELNKQLATATEEATKEYTTWGIANASLLLTEDGMIEAQNKYAEIIADHLSDINILGYLMATGLYDLDVLSALENSEILNAGNGYGDILGEWLGGYGDSDSDSDNDTSDKVEEVLEEVEGKVLSILNLVQAFSSLGFSAVIVILSIVTAIVSLVYFIKALIGLIKKQPQNKLFKYFGTILGLSGAMLILAMCTPLLAPSGGMLAIAVFISVMYFVCGAFGSFVFGKDGLLLSVKRTIIALLGMIAFFLLCTNVFASVEGNTRVETTVNAPMGYGLSYLFGGFIKAILSSSKASEQLALNLAGPMLNGITGFVTFLLMIFTVSFLLCAYKRTLKCLAFGTVEKSSCTAFAITGAIFALISIIVAMVVPGALLDLAAEAFGDGKFELDTTKLVVGFTVRAQVWVSMILFLVCAIFNIVFNPKSKDSAANQGQQL